MKKQKARPEYKGNRVRFSVVLPTTVFDALDANSPSYDMSWRQLAQQAIRDFAATLPEPAETEKITA